MVYYPTHCTKHHADAISICYRMNGGPDGWMVGRLNGRMGRKVGEKENTKEFSEKGTFQLKSKKEAVFLAQVAQGSGDSGRAGDRSTSRDILRTKDGKQSAAVTVTLSVQLSFSAPLIHKGLDASRYGKYKISFTSRGSARVL